MMMIMDYRLSTEVPLDLPQDAEKGLDHDGPHRPTTLAVIIALQKWKVYLEDFKYCGGTTCAMRQDHPEDSLVVVAVCNLRDLPSTWWSTTTTMNLFCASSFYLCV
jgi:hypothetical protein